jgi:hypothetical protein
MEKAEIQRIGKFLTDVREEIEGDDPVTMRLHLTELYKVIRTLTDEASKSKDQGLKAVLTTMEYKAQEYRAELEKRLGTRN